MRKTFDRRVVPDFALGFIRACQERVPCHLGGGAALAGVYLGHRTTGDVDLFVHDAEDMRALAGLLPAAAAAAASDCSLIRDAGHLVRAHLDSRDGQSVEVDLVYEPVADIEPPPPKIEGIEVESLAEASSKGSATFSRKTSAAAHLPPSVASSPWRLVSGRPPASTIPCK
jgi:hypothetical protein